MEEEDLQRVLGVQEIFLKIGQGSRLTVAN